MAWRAHHAAAGMRAGAAEIETLDGRAIAGALRGWAQREKLVRGDLALKDIAVGQAVALLDIEGTEHLAIEDRVREIGRELGHGSDDAIGHLILHLLGPRAALKMVGRVLAEHRDGVVARR